MNRVVNAFALEITLECGKCDKELQVPQLGLLDGKGCFTRLSPNVIGSSHY